MWYVRFNHPKGEEEARVFEGPTVDDIWPPFEEACTDWGLEACCPSAPVQVLQPRCSSVRAFMPRALSWCPVSAPPFETVSAGLRRGLAIGRDQANLMPSACTQAKP